MKKYFSVLILVAFALSFVSSAYAGEILPVKKLGRGLANCITCPLEIIKGIGDAGNENGVFAGLTWGVCQGVVNTVKRAVVGVYEVATFPIPFPKNYEPIITDPDFFLSNKKDTIQ